MEAAEATRQALLSRRRISLRLQIYLVFFIVFLFAVGIGTALIYSMYQVEGRLFFLEIVNDYVIEIQQARRFEKNYFLYGTNLEDALENVSKAREILDRNSVELNRILGKESQEAILANIKHYERLLEQLEELGQGGWRDRNMSAGKRILKLN